MGMTTSVEVQVAGTDTHDTGSVEVIAMADGSVELYAWSGTDEQDPDEPAATLDLVLTAAEARELVGALLQVLNASE